MATIPPSTALAAVPGPSGVATTPSNRTPRFLAIAVHWHIPQCMYHHKYYIRIVVPCFEHVSEASGSYHGEGTHPARGLQRQNGVIHLG